MGYLYSYNIHLVRCEADIGSHFPTVLIFDVSGASLNSDCRDTVLLLNQLQGGGYNVLYTGTKMAESLTTTQHCMLTHRSITVPECTAHA